MKKNTEAITAASSSDTTPTELKAQIQEHRIFFDKLIELVLAKFYLPNGDDSKPWYPGLSKQKKAFLRKQTLQNIKLSRRQRLDPDKVSENSTLFLLEKHNNRPEDDQSKPFSFGGSSDGHSLTFEERERLRLKLENRRKERKVQGNRGQRADDEGIEFGKVKLGGEEEKRGKKRKKMSKVKELEQAKRLKQIKEEKPDEAEKESWKAAMSRASGEKVHDDPRLLKKSMKKDKKRKEKNAEKLKKRVEMTEKMKEERQQKRKNNIAERARDKKARKIAKREKKLMRPGFEGRK